MPNFYYYSSLAFRELKATNQTNKRIARSAAYITRTTAYLASRIQVQPLKLMMFNAWSCGALLAAAALLLILPQQGEMCTYKNWVMYHLSCCLHGKDIALQVAYPNVEMEYNIMRAA